eukprot:TRINITY_DN7151_c0_g2_i10.p1 TRINITY_DN7151_c0_g2~~TRINITY_DN7151_c0_g2_i10.p1  ORF type:complete len:464 (+),score=184.21 TRINITY_DN7151_c0_g2_i10:64-1455(+)
MQVATDPSAIAYDDIHLQTIPHTDVTCGAIAGDVVYLGRASGDVLVYEYVRRQQLRAVTLRNVAACAGLRGEAVRQLVPVRCLDVLLCVVGGKVHVCDLSTLRYVGTAPGVSGCVRITAKRQRGAVVVAAVCKHCIELLQLSEAESGAGLRRMACRPLDVAAAGAVCWAGESGLCVAHGSGFSYVDYWTGRGAELPQSTRQRPPLCCAVAGPHAEVVNACGTVTQGVTPPTARRGWGLGFKHRAAGMLGAYPWVLSFGAADVEVHSLEARGLTQRIDTGGGVVVCDEFVDFDGAAAAAAAPAAAEQSLRRRGGGGGGGGPLCPPTVLLIGAGGAVRVLEPVPVAAVVDRLVRSRKAAAAHAIAAAVPHVVGAGCVSAVGLLAACEHIAAGRRTAAAGCLRTAHHPPADRYRDELRLALHSAQTAAGAADDAETTALVECLSRESVTAEGRANDCLFFLTRRCL